MASLNKLLLDTAIPISTLIEKFDIKFHVEDSYTTMVYSVVLGTPLFAVTTFGPDVWPQTLNNEYCVTYYLHTGFDRKHPVHQWKHDPKFDHDSTAIGEHWRVYYFEEKFKWIKTWFDEYYDSKVPRPWNSGATKLKQQFGEQGGPVRDRPVLSIGNIIANRNERKEQLGLTIKEETVDKLYQPEPTFSGALGKRSTLILEMIWADRRGDEQKALQFLHEYNQLNDETNNGS